MANSFNIWATSDAHVVREALGDGFDPDRKPRQSMAQAIADAQGPSGFDFDIGLHLGDILDYDHETAANFQMFRDQLATCRRDAHHWYHVGGNNDENSVLNDAVTIDNEHYRKIIDPAGEFTESSGIDNSRRPFPVQGTYERYHIDVGNLRILFLSDRNDLPAPFGRGEGGFYVDGAITLESYRWLIRQVITWPQRILMVACHHPLKDTTLGTEIDDSWTGQYMTSYHPTNIQKNTARLQGTLHQIHPIHDFDSPLFHHLLSQNHGVVDAWLSGHIHHRVEETYRGRGKYAKAYGGHHLNIGNLCRYRHFSNIISAQSNLLSLQEGSDTLTTRVFVHDHPTLPKGFYLPEDRRLTLKCAFSHEFKHVPVAKPQEHVSAIRTLRIGQGFHHLLWNSSSTGTLIVQADTPAIAFTPADGEVYYVSQQVDGGSVIHMGTSCKLSPVANQATTQYFHLYAYNAGAGNIKYQTRAPAVFKLDQL